MKRYIISAVLILATLSTIGGYAEVESPVGCLATNVAGPDTCTVIAGAENETTAAGLVVLGGRVSWVGNGEFVVQRFVDCADTTPDREWTTIGSDDPFKSNNGGGYFEYCYKATATRRGSSVAIGSIYFTQALQSPIGCAAVNSGDTDSCFVNAGAEEDATDAGAVVVGGRVSWAGQGSFLIQRFDTCDSTVELARWEYTGQASNNGGGYFGFCYKATALTAGSSVAISATYFPDVE